MDGRNVVVVTLPCKTTTTWRERAGQVRDWLKDHAGVVSLVLHLIRLM